MQLPLVTAAYGLAWARWHAGVGDTGAVAEMRDRRELLRKMQYRLYDPLYAKLLAEVEAGAGHIESALDVVNEAISEAERTGQRWFDAELYRTRGEIILQCRRPETTASEAAFKRAVDVTRRQQTRAFELRASLSLAKLYRSADARRTLTPCSRPRSKAFRRRRNFPKSRSASTACRAAFMSQSWRWRLPKLALHDRPPFLSRPSLTGHCGHGWTSSLPRPVAIDPTATSASHSATYDLSNTPTLPLCQQGVMGVTCVKLEFWSQCNFGHNTGSGHD